MSCHANYQSRQHNRIKPEMCEHGRIKSGKKRELKHPNTSSRTCCGVQGSTGDSEDQRDRIIESIQLSNTPLDDNWTPSFDGEKERTETSQHLFPALVAGSRVQRATLGTREIGSSKVFSFLTLRLMTAGPRPATRKKGESVTPASGRKAYPAPRNSCRQPSLFTDPFIEIFPKGVLSFHEIVFPLSLPLFDQTFSS